MADQPETLNQRIRSLRRRHFGPQGKGEFARRLGLDEAAYGRYELNQIPPGDVLVRMCELTGEDLQWLLTGVAARGTVVISGARGRHQQLLGRVAELLERRPSTANAIEAFLALLDARVTPPQLPPAPPRGARGQIPILDAEELPEFAPTEAWLEEVSALSPPEAPHQMRLLPALQTDAPPLSAASTPVMLLALRRSLDGPALRLSFERLFGVRTHGLTGSVPQQRGEIALASAAAEPELGHPVLCRCAAAPIARAGVWLGGDARELRLGLADGSRIALPAADVLWTAPIVFWLEAA